MKRPPEEPSRAGSDGPFPDKSVGEPNQQNCSVQLQGETAEQLFTTCDLCWGEANSRRNSTLKHLMERFGNHQEDPEYF